jgi:hypothetical protein
MLRELVLGRATFDRAFADYARAWQFKRPTPGDFFRSIEHSSGRKLDWFWRGWFFGTSSFDMGVTGVTRFDGAPPPPTLRPAPPAGAGAPEAALASLTLRGNHAAGIGTAVGRDASLGDYYSGPSTTRGRGSGKAPPFQQDPWMAETLAAAKTATPFIYGVTLTNTGGLLLPQRVRFTFRDGSHVDQAVPVEMWRGDAAKIIVPVYSPKELVRVDLDPDRLTPDASRKDNVFDGAITTAPIQPARADRDDRGAMAADGVTIDRTGNLIRK